MIKSFKDRRTEAAYNGAGSKGFPTNLLKVVRRKLRMIHRATILSDLRMPPGNKLEALKGDRVGQHSIRVNEQFRICFVWREGEGVYDVEFIDYHD